MAAIPLIEELSGSASGQMIADLAGVGGDFADIPLDALRGASLPDSPRKLSVYAASAGFDLVDELDHLAARSVEPNVFFNPRFLAPAMPRLEDRDVFLAVMRDENDQRKEPTISEKVALAEAIAERLGKRQGQRTDLGTSGNISPSDDAGRTKDIAASKAGLGSGKPLEAAQKVTQALRAHLAGIPGTDAAPAERRSPARTAPH